MFTSKFLGRERNFGVDGFVAKTVNKGLSGKDYSYGFGVTCPNDLWSASMVIEPKSTVRGVKLEPIKLPLSEIAAAAEARIQQVLPDYREKKRGRPGPWPLKFNKALARVSDALQDISDEQLAREVADYRRERRAGKK